ncbi:tachykinin-like peptides receptor 99D isoform X1 [Drosophila sulfurigaster albostrigata]|uniref:tachykinin-like peptides receptor 99D isoform X1 n=1 Tax=Drosophila sulfurigaster albostrigata TaxID=89887 RepID=UPI002D219347|nr:tachykinin-like peptides receptor 99D isoform X1 [Drosophila sulfurigaster albostrigata]XP_062124333.1 tachykinin-like peptides receptor 99D isoform X1 [Drosophila sulfurigaster albostrigata]
MENIDELVDSNDSDHGNGDISYSWSNWSTLAPAIIYNAMNSVMAVANQTPLPDFNQDFRHNSLTYNLSRVLPTGITGLTAGDVGFGVNGDHEDAASPDAKFAFVVPWWRQVLWSILFGGMVIVATGGNLIVVWIVLTTKRMRTVTNYFIVNLSIADAMVSSLNVTFNYYYMLDGDWPFGEFYCKVSQFIAMLSICASVFTLMAISIDRYVAIMKPLQPRMSKRRNLAIAAVIWLSSTLISCPMLLFFKTEEVPVQNTTRSVCFPEWPDGQTNHSKQEHLYNILILILTYFLPIVSMTVTYSRVGIELWGSKTIGEYTPRQVENVRSKRRVVKMMIVVVLIFGVCWLPFHTYFIITSCYPAITEAPFIQELYLAIYWLAMSNSMYNPIIYCWMNSRFRYGFKMVFRWCPFVNVGAESLNRRDNLTSRYSCSGSPDHNRIKRNDTQKSILYACPGSPKSHRVSHCGLLRNSVGRTVEQVASEGQQRHSMPVSRNSGGPISLRGHRSPYQQEMQERWSSDKCSSGINMATESRTTNLLP